MAHLAIFISAFGQQTADEPPVATGWAMWNNGSVEFNADTILWTDGPSEINQKIKAAAIAAASADSAIVVGYLDTVSLVGAAV
jgi:hypothetical protein